MNPIRIIGIGNPFGGDDAVGILVAHRLIACERPGIDIVEASLSGVGVLELLEGAEVAIIIDAVQSGNKEGTIFRLEIPKDLSHVENLAWNSVTSSTHAYGLGEALELGNILGTLPQYLIIYGIELAHLSKGQSVSANVSKAAETVAVRILKELEGLACTNFN